MQPRFERITYPEQDSIIYFEQARDHYPFQWHFHPEFELTWLHGYRGLRYVGNHVESLPSRDLVLLGGHLPHAWAAEAVGGSSNKEAVVLQFLPDRLLGDQALPELEPIRELLHRAELGLTFGVCTQTRVGPLRQRLGTSKGVHRLIAVLMLLSALAEATDVRPLASDCVVRLRSRQDEERTARVMEILHARFREPLKLDELAAAVGMSRSAFCRFFKRTAGTGLVEYLTELRLSYACGLLRESERTIAEVCYDSGFGNLSNFNRQFRARRGRTPSAYRAAWRRAAA